MDINQGMQVSIPADLRMGNYPKSFQFYDFIINYIKKEVSSEFNDTVMDET